MVRVSLVGGINVHEVTLSSTLLVGDIVHVTNRSRALAVQRQEAVFRGDEGSFEKFGVFSRPIPKPIVDEPETIVYRNEDPFIRVNLVNIISISSSSLTQVGSNRTIDLESRVKHIRQLLPRSAPS
jgi:spore germination protein PE